MGTLHNWLQDGMSMPQARRWKQRLGLRIGRWLALRHGDVRLDPTAKISSDAHIHARQGTIQIGPNCTVAMGAVMQGNVTLGSQCSIQCYSVLVGYEGGAITLGDGVRIAPHVMMIAANHVFDDPTRPIHQQGLRAAPITVQDDVWIAGRVMVTAGVTIGRGSVIGAGAVVTRDVPEGVIAAGVPARVIRER